MDSQHISGGELCGGAGIWAASGSRCSGSHCPPPTSPNLGLGGLYIKQLSFPLVIKPLTTLERMDVNSEHVNKELENIKKDHQK